MPASTADDGAEKAANPPPDPGSRLRQAREAQGLSLEELGNELRLGAAALAALEENRFEALGATVFAKGYLKQYGTRLGLDVRELADLYERAEGKPQVEIAPSRGIKLRDERPVARWVVRMLLVGIVIGGSAYWWMQRPPPDAAVTAGGDDNISAPPVAGRAVAEPAVAARSPEEPAAPVPDSESAPAVADTDSAPDIADSDAVPALTDTEAPLATATDNAALSASDSDQTLLADETAADVLSEVEPAPEAIADPLPVSSSAQVAAANGPAIEVHFLEESWAEVTDEDGTRLYYDLGRPGTRIRFPADRNLSFSFGNGAPVEISIDSESVAVPGAGQRDVVRFSLDELIN